MISNTEYLILNVLAEYNGSMSLASFLNKTKAKNSIYTRKVMRSLEKKGFISESSQIVALTDDGYSRHASLKAKQASDNAYRTGEWIRWSITTIIAIIALVRTFL